MEAGALRRGGSSGYYRRGICDQGAVQARIRSRDYGNRAGRSDRSSRADGKRANRRDRSSRRIAQASLMGARAKSIVQQNITNTSTDLDEDEELIRFVFGYRRANDPESVAEQQYNGVSCRALTLEQVNETLTYYFGKTVSPDREDYSITLDENESFYCVYRDGWFLNVPPYPTEEFSFPIRFALVERVDEETCTLHFRLYQINPYAWGVGEAERHVPILPIMSIFDAERTNDATRDWIARLGKGEAVLRDLGEDLQLVEMTFGGR